MKNTFSFLALLALVSCYSPKKIAETKSENLSLDASYKGGDLEEIVKPYRQEVESQMNEVIAVSDYDIVKYAPTSPLSSLVADIVFDKGMELLSDKGSECTLDNTFCLLNFGGLRAPLNKGDVTIGNVYELMPFDNTVCVVTISPHKIKDFVVYMNEVGGQPISNLILDLSVDKEQLQIGGKDFDMNKNVHIITSNYLATGGDKMSFLKDPISKIELNVLIRDAIIDYFKKTKVLTKGNLAEDRINLK